MQELSFKIINNFFNAILEDQIPLTTLISESLYQKFQNSFMLNKSFNETYGRIEFDKEIDTLMDEKTKNMVLILCKSK